MPAAASSMPTTCSRTCRAARLGDAGRAHALVAVPPLGSSRSITIGATNSEHPGAPPGSGTAGAAEPNTCTASEFAVMPLAVAVKRPPAHGVLFATSVTGPAPPVQPAPTIDAAAGHVGAACAMPTLTMLPTVCTEPATNRSPRPLAVANTAVDARTSPNDCHPLLPSRKRLLAAAPPSDWNEAVAISSPFGSSPRLI